MAPHTESISWRFLRPEWMMKSLLVGTFIVLSTFSCLEYYQEPTFSQVQLEPADFPAFTLCTGLSANSSMFRRARNSFEFELLRGLKSPRRFRNLTAREVYDNLSLNFDKIFGYRRQKWNSKSVSNFVGSHSDMGEWWRSYFKGGTCYTYKPTGWQNRNGHFWGPFFQLVAHPEFTQKSTNIAYSLHIHGNNGPLSNIHFSYAEESSPRVNLLTGSSTDIEITINRYRTVSLRRASCNRTKNYSRSICLSSCVYDQQIKQLGCAMIYMNRSDVRLCRLGEVFYSDLNVKKYIPNCKCLPACQQDRITAAVSTSRFMAFPGKVRVSFIFYYRVDTRVTLLKVGLKDVLVNMGGFIGLLLGWSLLSVGRSILEALKKKQHVYPAAVAGSRSHERSHTNLLFRCGAVKKQAW